MTASPTEQPGGGQAGITVTRRIEWMDTDAAGVYHWTTVYESLCIARRCSSAGIGEAATRPKM